MTSYVSRPLDADLAPGHPGPERAGLECLRHRLVELRAALDRGQPEAELVGEVVTGASAAAALNEGGSAEVLETGARAGEGLAAALCAGGSVLEENTS